MSLPGFSLAMGVCGGFFLSLGNPARGYFTGKRKIKRVEFFLPWLYGLPLGVGCKLAGADGQVSKMVLFMNSLG